VSTQHRPSVTAFAGQRMLARGPLPEVALAVKQEVEARPQTAVLVFDDTDGKVIDLDLRGRDEDMLKRLGHEAGSTAATEGAKPGRGRPKLGVVAREVTLLPRHWDWLAAQPGGASQALRRLVDQARTADEGRSARRAATDAAYRFMAAMAGDLPGFEEASRALFAGDEARFREEAAGWPADVSDHALRLWRRSA
jgi:hypothetical protein